jgi:hypothetical protein
VAAKRSPILGYNHNVKYRGVVFHVQTEDSGLLNPHLFTHLFHEGVIVSTRKLVYDAGSNEEAIKALMQAQHKAVMKDLMKGSFDQKIDQYLTGVEGLEPSRGSAGKPAPARGERAPTEADAPLEVTTENLSEPIELPIKGSRADTGDRTRPMSIDPPAPPPPGEDNAPTLMGSSAAEMAAAFQAAEAARKAQAEAEQQPTKSRTSTAQRGSRSAVGQARNVGGGESPVLEIIDDADSLSARNRLGRDTTVELGDNRDGIPTRDTQDSIPPPTVPVRQGQHPAAAAATLKAPQRSAQSPAIITRPVTSDRRRPDDSEAVEIYQPAPASVEPPPGERAERPGQYSVSRKTGDAPLREKTGKIAAINPATLGQQSGSGSTKTPTARPAGSAPGSQPNRTPTNVPREPTPQNQRRAQLEPGKAAAECRNRAKPPQGERRVDRRQLGVVHPRAERVVEPIHRVRRRDERVDPVVLGQAFPQVAVPVVRQVGRYADEHEPDRERDREGHRGSWPPTDPDHSASGEPPDPSDRDDPRRVLPRRDAQENARCNRTGQGADNRPPRGVMARIMRRVPIGRVG